MRSLLEDCALIYTHTVTWGEMDAFNHVNNTEYFRYFEHARIRHFEEIGMLSYMETHNIGPILGETRCRFKLPLTYPDTVHIGVTVEDLQNDRFVHRYRLFSDKHQTIAAEGEGRIVYFDYSRHCKTDLPQALLAKLQGDDSGPVRYRD